MAKQSTPRGLRDEANVGPDPRRARRLVPLSELGKFKVADGDPDIRGWSAYTSTGREIGRVSELLVDTDSNEVVMLDIDLRRDDRHTLAPLRAAWVDHAARRVVIDVAELNDADLPSLARGGATTDDELRRFDESYDRAYGRYHDDRELRLRHADEELRFGRRATDRVADQGVEHAEPDVPRRSHIVERHRPAEPADYRVSDVGEREVRFPRYADQRVVERRPLADDPVVERRPVDDRIDRRP